MSGEMGPVQLIAIGFPPGANFEGRIMDELSRLEGHETIRIRDRGRSARLRVRGQW
jgi:hypothetical protein